jgi:hypothetical protein
MTTARGIRQKESRNVGPFPEYVNFVCYYTDRSPPLRDLSKVSLARLASFIPLGDVGLYVASPSWTSGLEDHCLDETNVSSCCNRIPEDAVELFFEAERWGRKSPHLDYLWMLGCKRPQASVDWNISTRLTVLYISIRDTYVRSREPTKMVDALFDLIATQSEATYAFAEVSTPETFGEASGYCKDWARPSLEFALREKIWWSPRTNHERQVRGVYWGNYFSPAIVAEMRKGEEDAIEAFAKYPEGAPDRAPNGDPRVKLYNSGAAYLSLGHDIMQMSVIDGHGTRAGASEIWLAELLYMHLRSRNLIV